MMSVRAGANRKMIVAPDRANNATRSADVRATFASSDVTTGNKKRELERVYL
jgi:hypothetical protein